MVYSAQADGTGSRKGWFDSVLIVLRENSGSKTILHRTGLYGARKVDPSHFVIHGIVLIGSTSRYSMPEASSIY